MTVRHTHGRPAQGRGASRFEHRIIAFSERFLSTRTFELIVAPALADLQFDECATGRQRLANYMAVLRAVAGGVRDEITRDWASFLILTALPVSYYTFLLIVFSDFFPADGFVLVVAALILVLSLGPVMACFWPTRVPARSAD